MDGSPKDSAVYFIDRGAILSGHIRQKKERIDEQMGRIQEDLDRIRAAQKAMEEIEAILLDMRALAVRAAGDADADRDVLNREFQTLKARIDEAVRSAEHSGVNLLDGSLSAAAAIIAAIGDTLC